MLLACVPPRCVMVLEACAPTAERSLIREDGGMHEQGVRPARPHHRLTEDGRRMREVLTYSRRGSRFSPRQQAGLGRPRRSAGGSRTRPSTSPASRWPTWFGREAPLIVEIGSGVGEATAALAAARPAYDVLAFEVWRPGVADGLGRVAEAGATNVRFCSVDAVWSMEHLVGPGRWRSCGRSSPTRGRRRGTTSADWSRRSSRGSRRAGSRPGGWWRLATDWADYAEQMVEVLDAEPALEGGVVAALGRAAGHQVRAQGRRRRPGDHRPGLRPTLTAGLSASAAATSWRSVRSWPRMWPGSPVDRASRNAPSKVTNTWSASASRSIRGSARPSPRAAARRCPRARRRSPSTIGSDVPSSTQLALGQDRDVEAARLRRHDLVGRVLEVRAGTRPPVRPGRRWPRARAPSAGLEVGDVGGGVAVDEGAGQVELGRRSGGRTRPSRLPEAAITWSTDVAA